jgi:seryl-tRNA synthetase
MCRGLYRVHQFSKVEMFGICRPEDSEAMHEELITIEEDLYTSLGLHFKWVYPSSALMSTKIFIPCSFLFYQVLLNIWPIILAEPLT